MLSVDLVFISSLAVYHCPAASQQLKNTSKGNTSCAALVTCASHPMHRNTLLSQVCKPYCRLVKCV